ncbi:aromatic ring-hydroxylating oxygenase subunit alpha [Aestuariivirga litoralis]|uniref:aromatic ring-hydroxylating oxygenase subunit alpha n=1 Tax=Aestuariivirga litoralis TaxID=2650924 RepID=UPI0018C60095|nr:aromatic ring-hydroxylating dioxygenase subunit alpha [Aestuariivirga litoralis]MBG1230771.1 aromatic ring-hydroxylating dioxygenase subunit alpha [Aestuariivirga litoralis]
MSVEHVSASASNDWDRSGLPGWTYHSEEMFDLEMNGLFLTHWQIAGHVSDVPKPGNFITFDLANERAVIIRGQDGVLRAFHNLCRHRGSRVVTTERGTCKNALVCPFHGWVYNLDGTLRGPAQPKSYPPLDKNQFGLKPVEMEVWMGFIFVRFKSGPQGSVAQFLKPYEAEFAMHRTESVVPAGGATQSTLSVNWKSVRDVDNEGYHVAMAHPALHDLYGYTYRDEFYAPGLRVSKGTYLPDGGKLWSVKNYLKFSKGREALPPERRNLWAYYGAFPNNVFILTPESVQFYQELPVDVGHAVVRGIVYHYPDESREEKLARYLTYRIDRETFAEDMQLSIWSNESMKSSGFDGFYLSDHERGVRLQHDELRELFPVMNLKRPPSGELAELNQTLLKNKSQEET